MTILMYAIGVFVASLLTIFMVYGTSDGTDGSIETSEQVKIMTTQEKIDFILAKKKEGKAVYYVSPNELEVTTLKDLCNQPASGILYDLNRDEASILAFASEDNPYWVNNYATAQVIRYLKGRVEELEQQLNKEEEVWKQE